MKFNLRHSDMQSCLLCHSAQHEATSIVAVLQAVQALQVGLSVPVRVRQMRCLLTMAALL